MAEFEHYQGVYCSLCKQLGKRYGVMARMTLSYDFTFLAIFRMALSDVCTGFKKGRCAFNPLKKRTCCCENAHVNFCGRRRKPADVPQAEGYHRDNGFFTAFRQGCCSPLPPTRKRRRRRPIRSWPGIYRPVWTGRWSWRRCKQRLSTPLRSPARCCWRIWRKWGPRMNGRKKYAIGSATVWPLDLFRGCGGGPAGRLGEGWI